MNRFRQDLRYGWRTLRANPGFTLAAVLTLALGIGANTAVFSVVRGVLLEPLPYAEPERLVLVWNRMTESNFLRAPVAAPDLADYRNEARLFTGFAASNNVGDSAWSGDGEPQRIKLAGVTDNFFTVLGAPPLLGRTFVPEDGTPLAPPADGDDAGPQQAPPTALVLSHGFWQRALGGDPEVIGRSLEIGGQPLVVVGVMPESFALLMPPDAGMPTDIDAWRPLRFDLSTGARDQQFLRVIARLAPGVTLAAAQAEMDAMAARQREQFAFHKNMGVSIVVQPMHSEVVGHVQPVLLALTGAVGFVLLIACANVANLLLARGAARGREMAVRSALGAGRGRLIGQLLTEGLLLAVLGGGAGLVLALAGVPLLTALRPPDLPRVEAVRVDGVVLAFTAAATLAAALLFALVPALRASAAPAASGLGERGGGTGGPGWARGGLTVVQVALSLVLAIGAGLMLRSFINLHRVDPGFDARGVLTFTVNLPFSRYGTLEERFRGLAELEAGLATLPGVDEVGAVFPLPLGGRFWTGPYGEPDGTPEEWSKNEANFRPTTPGYLEAMGIRVREGRTLTVADIEEQQEVVVVDETLARRLGGGAPVVGRRIGLDLFGEQHKPRIVGVVEPIRHETLTATTRETIYFPHHYFPWGPMTLAVRGGGDPATLASVVRREVAAHDADVPIYDVRTMADYLASARSATRFTLLVIALFAALAVALAVVGLAGVLSFAVHQRSREIGIRLALGARPGRILAAVVGRGALLAGIGLALGLAAALPLTGALGSLLYEVSPLDPLTYVVLALLLALVALLAAYLPARRAAAVDPMESLRLE